MAEFEDAPTVKQVIDALSSMPNDARVCVFADEQNLATFYVQSIGHDESKNRVVFYPPDSANASEANDMDAGAGWHQ